MRFFCLLIIQLLCGQIFAQKQQVKSRVILIGDAGDLSPQQQAIIPQAASLVLPHKTTVLFLGDNIYPDGMPPSGHKDEIRAQKIMQSQYLPMRGAGAPVYFLPGNHDWDYMGKDGLAKIRAQGEFLASQQDSLLTLIPANGCPGPVEIPISEDLVLIAYDSEYWLFPHQRTTPNVDCECTSKTDFLQQLDALLYENQHKTILLASHHPMRTYGTHGGYYSLKQHIFPLTEKWQNLYIPLPIVGSLYPLLRSTVLQTPEDRPHPLYSDLASEVTAIFKKFPNIIYVAGHDHGLQFIQDPDITQVVSGSGAKSSYIYGGKYLKYKYPKQGLVLIDQLRDNSTKISFYIFDNQSLKEDHTYIKPYKDIQYLIDSAYHMTAGEDSVTVQVNPKYDTASKFQRFFLGENYRKEWAAPTTLPVLRISELYGGLKPTKRGGGMQSISIRLEDSTGREWALRSVNKRTESLIPEELHNTFVQNILDDANSAQHPYSALMVPPLADAVNVTVARPIIGVIAPDSSLGAYNSLFANQVALLEEREPLGKSDNTIKMLQKLQDDNDHEVKAKAFLRARMLDVLINDWDRHEDQWRWYNENKGTKNKDRDYIPIPRDRDQALRVTQGFITSNIYQPFIMPTMQGFSPKISRINYSIIKSRFLNATPSAQLSYDDWMKEVHQFTDRLTDSVLQSSVHKLPQSSIDIRGRAIFETLRSRRDALPKVMKQHYEFINNIVDIHLSDKNEKVVFEDATQGGLNLSIHKINKDGAITKSILNRTFTPNITKEIRLYLGKGADSVVINDHHSIIKIRIIGDYDPKSYQLFGSSKRLSIYDNSSTSTVTGSRTSLPIHTSTDSSNVAFVPVNLYNSWLPLLSAGYNVDDGILLGVGFKYTHQRGFRKSPFTHTQEFGISGSIRTGAYRLNYRGHWKDVLGPADLVIDALAKAPDNSQNFFGMGNSSSFLKDTYGSKYYRARFNLYQLTPQLHWEPTATFSYSIGPSIQHYHLDQSQNTGRFILTDQALHSYDSLTVAKDKTFIGISARLKQDNRNSPLHPTRGGYFKATFDGFTGMSRHARSYAQITAEIGFYKGISQDAIVFANRFGAGSNFGKPAFYQSLFLGGQGNLRGFRQYRFAGDQYIYNNFEARVRLQHIDSYIFPGEIGVLGLYDVGRVWSKAIEKDNLHHGVGGGAYYILAKMVALQFVMAHSNEGWYPYFSMGFRF
jgi:hypothetical protein